MDFRILGPLQVVRGDHVLDLGTPAQRRLLAVLLTRPNVPVPLDTLVDEMWGDGAPSSAHHLVRVYASRLRRVLDDGTGPSRVIRDGAGYAVRAEPGEIDADRFADLVQRARADVDRDPGATADRLEQALRLWHGAPFEDCDDPPPAVRNHATFLEQRRLEARVAWAEANLRLGRHRELVPELADLVRDNPYDEMLHSQLMLALYRSGRQAEALATARALQQRLRDELGLDPSPEIADLYHRILMQAPDLRLEPPETPGNLPAALTSLVGRVREIDEVASLLDAARLVTLTGTGGIGKTRLAIEVGWRTRDRFPDGVWWVDLAQVVDPEMVEEALAAVLGLNAPPGAPFGELIARALGHRRALLLLDNCEHVAPAVAQMVAGLLGSTTSPRILATSRMPLRVDGEQLCVVPPLQLPARDDATADIAASDAVRLFVERGRAADPSFVFDAATAPVVADVCRRLDGLSLAIEMAAARLPLLTPREIADHLDRRFALLELDATGRLTRHLTMEAAIDASYALLTGPQQIAFERLAVFLGAFDLDAAAAVGRDVGEPAVDAAGSGGDGLGVVGALANASMLAPVRVGDQTRYRMLETVREFGAIRLHRRGTEGATRRAHADHFIDLAAAAGTGPGTPAFAAWMDRFDEREADLRQALAWSLAHEPRAVTLGAAPALCETWYRRGDAREAARWSARMLEGDLAGVPPHLLAWVHGAASFAADLASDFVAAGTHADAMIRLAREAGDAHAVVFGLSARSHAALGVGDLVTMHGTAIEGLTECDRIGAGWERAGPLTALGYAALFGGSAEEARSWFEQGIPLLREAGDRGGLVIHGLVPASEAALRQEDLAAAERFATEAVEAGSGTAWEAAALVQYAIVMNAAGDAAAARVATIRGLRVALEAGLEQWFRMVLREIARADVFLDRFGEAAITLGASRVHMPAPTLDPAIYGPVEARCREALGAQELDDLLARGTQMTHDQLVDLVGAT